MLVSSPLVNDVMTHSLIHSFVHCLVHSITFDCIYLKTFSDFHPNHQFTHGIQRRSWCKCVFLAFISPIPYIVIFIFSATHLTLL